MRIKSELWVQGYLRAVQAGGAFATLIKRGDADAGAILIRINRLDGTGDLYGPAPPDLNAADEDVGRRFTRLNPLTPAPDEALEATIARQQRFDSDLWIVEVEDRQGRSFLDDWMR